MALTLSKALTLLRPLTLRKALTLLKALMVPNRPGFFRKKNRIF
jgi:hypothetical protein